MSPAQVTLSVILAVCGYLDGGVGADGYYGPYSNFPVNGGFNNQYPTIPTSSEYAVPLQQGEGYYYPKPQVPFRYPFEEERTTEKRRLYDTPSRTTTEAYRERDQELLVEKDREKAGRPGRQKESEIEDMKTEVEKKIKEDDDRQDKLREMENQVIKDREKLEEEVKRLKMKNEEEDDEERKKNKEKEEKLRMELEEKELELEEREEQLRVLREQLEEEDARRKDEASRQMIVDQLVAEYRNKTLSELQNFGETLKENQAMEDQARRNVTTVAPGGGRGRVRQRVTEEREEIIRRGTGPPIVNRRTNTTEREQEIETGSGGSRRVQMESVSRRQSSSRRVVGGTGGNPDDDDADAPAGGRVSGSRSSSRSSSSSSRSSSSRGGGRSGDDDGDDDGGASGGGGGSSSRSSSSRSSSSGSSGGGGGGGGGDEEFDGDIVAGGSRSSSRSTSRFSSGRSASSGSSSRRSSSSRVADDEDVDVRGDIIIIRTANGGRRGSSGSSSGRLSSLAGGSFEDPPARFETPSVGPYRLPLVSRKKSKKVSYTDAESSGSDYVPFRDIEARFFSGSALGSVSSIQDILEATSHTSFTVYTDKCPPGRVYAVSTGKCIFWG